jgi:hypothetical protein
MLLVIVKKGLCEECGHCATYRVIQDEQNMLGGDSIGLCEKKQVHINMCLILNDNRDKRFFISKRNSFGIFSFVRLLALDVERSLRKKSRYTRRTAR